MSNNLIFKDMTNENTRKYRCVTMAEYAHDLIVILNRMSTPRPFDAVDGYPIMYESVNTLIYYTDAIRIIINSPKAPLVFLHKQRILKLIELLEQYICFINWRSDDFLFDIKKYGMSISVIIQKQINKIMSSLRVYVLLGNIYRRAKIFVYFFTHFLMGHV